MAKKAPKYSDPKRVVKQGVRRVTKTELKKLGYSQRSVLYVPRNVKNPTKFLTRTDLKKYLPERQGQPKGQFTKLSRERIRALKKKRFKHTYTIYSDYKKPINYKQAAILTEQFFQFLQQKHRPVSTNSIGVVYIGIDDSFSRQPVLWQSKETIIERLIEYGERYKKNLRITYIVGWIMQSS